MLPVPMHTDCIHVSVCGVRGFMSCKADCGNYIKESAPSASTNNARDETVRSCVECKVPNRTIESCFFCFLEKYQRTASPVA